MKDSGGCQILIPFGLCSSFNPFCFSFPLQDQQRDSDGIPPAAKPQRNPFAIPSQPPEPLPCWNISRGLGWGSSAQDSVSRSFSGPGKGARRCDPRSWFLAALGTVTAPCQAGPPCPSPPRLRSPSITSRAARSSIPAPRRCSLAGGFNPRFRHFCSSLAEIGVGRAGAVLGPREPQPGDASPAPPAALPGFAEGADIPGRISGALHLKNLPATIPALPAIRSVPWPGVGAFAVPQPRAAAGDPQDPPCPPEGLPRLVPAAPRSCCPQPSRAGLGRVGHCRGRRGSGRAELSPAAFQRCCHILPRAPNDSFGIAVLPRLLFVAGLILTSQ